MKIPPRTLFKLQGRVSLVFLPVFGLLIFAVLAMARNVFVQEPAVDAVVRRQRETVKTAEQAAREVEKRMGAFPAKLDLGILNPARRKQAPKKPEKPKPPPVRPVPREGTYRIEGTAMRGGRLVALVNGELVEAGQTVGGSRIIKITRREVTVQDAHGKIRTFSVYEDLDSVKGQTNAVSVPR